MSLALICDDYLDEALMISKVPVNDCLGVNNSSPVSLLDNEAGLSFSLVHCPPLTRLSRETTGLSLLCNRFPLAKLVGLLW